MYNNIYTIHKYILHLNKLSNIFIFDIIKSINQLRSDLFNIFVFPTEIHATLRLVITLLLYTGF